jgi:hypothetical protein
MAPNQNNLSDVLTATVPEIYRIGDCIRFDNLIDAVPAGFFALRLIMMPMIGLKFQEISGKYTVDSLLSKAVESEDQNALV